MGSRDHLEWHDWTVGAGGGGEKSFLEEATEKGGPAAERRRERGRGRAWDLRGGCERRGTNHDVLVPVPVPRSQVGCALKSPSLCWYYCCIHLFTENHLVEYIAAARVTA